MIQNTIVMANTNTPATPQSRVKIDLKTAQRVFDAYSNVSEATRNDYKRRIADYIDYLNHNGLNQTSLIDYRRSLELDTTKSISTKNKLFIVAKVFSGMLYNTGTIPMDITKDISGRTLRGFSQSAKHKKDGITADEVHEILAYLQSPSNGISSRQTIRLAAIFSLLIYQGLRQIELTRLDVADIDLKHGTALILGKGRDDREPIALHPHTVEALRLYLTTYNKRSGALFTSESNHGHGERLTTRTIRRLVTDVYAKLGIDNTTHATRHFFTTNMIQAYHGDLLRVAHYTRHKSLEMLQVYNDAIKAHDDLPNYYKAFNSIV